MAFHHFKNDAGDEYGSFETFYEPKGWRLDGGRSEGDYEPGWYWWACFPGCLPDGAPMGPFATEQEAIDDAQSNA